MGILRGYVSEPRVTVLHTAYPIQGEYPDRSQRPRLFSGLWLQFTRDLLGPVNHRVLIGRVRHTPMDGSGAPPPGALRLQEGSPDERIGLLRAGDGGVRSPQWADTIRSD